MNSNPQKNIYREKKSMQAVNIQRTRELRTRRSNNAWALVDTSPESCNYGNVNVVNIVLTFLIHKEQHYIFRVGASDNCSNKLKATIGINIGFKGFIVGTTSKEGVNLW